MIDLLQMCNHSPIPSTPTPFPHAMLLIMYLVGICIHLYGQVFYLWQYYYLIKHGSSYTCLGYSISTFAYMKLPPVSYIAVTFCR